MKKSFFYLIVTTLILIPVVALAQVNVVSTNVNNEVVNIKATTNLNSNTASTGLTKLETDINSELADPGFLPDSPFYFVKSWLEGIQSFFTFNAEKKAELQYKFAMRRVAEVNKLIEKGKTDKAVKHMKKYEDHLKKFADRVAKFDGKKSNKAEELADKLELLQERQQNVLSDVYDKVPEEAQEGILNAMENSSKDLEVAIEKIEGQEKLESFRERFKTRVENEYNSKSKEVKESLKNRAEEMVKNRLNKVIDNEDNENLNVNTNTAVEDENDDQADNNNSNSDDNNKSNDVIETN